MLGGAAVRRKAIAELFESVEASFGDIAALTRETGSKPAVLTTPALSAAALADLFTHKIAAIRVPGFFPRRAATALAEEL